MISGYNLQTVLGVFSTKKKKTVLGVKFQLDFFQKKHSFEVNPLIYFWVDVYHLCEINTFIKMWDQH